MQLLGTPQRNGIKVRILHTLIDTSNNLGGVVVKNLPANSGDARDTDSIPVSERPPGEGNHNLLQYS